MNPNYGDVFDAVARVVQPADPAIYCDDRVVDWSEFDRSSNALARALCAAGLAPGAKVAQYMRNSPEYLIVFAAAFKARLAPVNVNYRYGVDEVGYILNNCDAEAVLFDAEFATIVSQLKDRVPTVRVWISVGLTVPGCARFEHLSSGDGRPLDIARSPADLLLLYTGGTTGMPKGVMWPSETLWDILAPWRAPALGLEIPNSVEELCAQIRGGLGREPVYVTCPLMHGTGMVTSLAAITKGAPVVITRTAPFDPSAALDSVTRLRCGVLIIVGDAFARPLLDCLRAEPTRYDVSCLRVVASSGMMWSPAVKQGLLEYMPDAVLFDSFGASEGTAMGTSITTRDKPPTEARFDGPDSIVVRDSDFAPVAPGSGEVGLVAKRGQLPLGYYKDPGKTASTYVTINGERHVITGDHATVEADGTIHLLGRGNQCINSGGEKIYAEEVEEVLKTHPAVRDALVFGVPDVRFGHAVTAVVAVVEGASVTDAQLVDHVRARLAAFKAPRRIAFTREVPRSPSGKADYTRAKAVFAESFSS
ncbi:MAG: AMP-binding protein [Chloroflexi bacterium]|nr:AMP-binding protein [Chloroflexota bacterium]